jgi:hypothetical protein
MPYISTESTSIEFGTSLRIGYRIYGSITPFNYLSYYPSYNELPYTFEVPSVGIWEIEYTQLCSSCSGTGYSDPQTTVVTLF